MSQNNEPLKRGVAGPPEDPVNLMQQVFDHAPEFMGPAPDILLSWLMRLDARVDQPSAARWVLQHYAEPARATANAESLKLIDLLEQASRGERIDRPQRRGGRQGRLS